MASTLYRLDGNPPTGFVRADARCAAPRGVEGGVRVDVGMALAASPRGSKQGELRGSAIAAFGLEDRQHTWSRDPERRTHASS